MSARPILPLLLVIAIVPRAGTARLQDDPVRGTWRGTVKSAESAESAISITIIRKGDAYDGFTTGMGESNAIPLKRVAVGDGKVSVEVVAESKLGQVLLAADLALEGNALKGAGTLAVGPHRTPVTLQLQRRPRQDVAQPQVEPRLEYFVGKWAFEYVGAEIPPLSAGTRAGTVTFSPAGSSGFAAGQAVSDVLGKKYQENFSIGFDPEARALVFLERRSDASELVSVANWQSPLAITFRTAPVRAGARTYQLRRVVTIRSDNAFEITEEYSVDGGPYRRLGNASYTKVP